MTDATLTIPVYDFIIRIIISDNVSEINKALEESGHNEDMGDGGMMVLHSDYKVYTLSVLEEAISPGNIAHEAGHLTNRVWRDIGGLLDYTNDEPYCYLLGFITDGITQIINKHETTGD